MIKTIKGDLISLALAGEFDVIAHGCNCMCTMARGIALSIKQTLPEVYKTDCKTKKADKNKLGTCSVTECQTENGTFTVVNAYTQFEWKGAGVKADYEAIRSCMNWINKKYPNNKIGLPKIGAGLARGDWNRVLKIISEELTDSDVTIVEFTAQ